MPHDPDFTVRIVDANGDPDHTVAVVDGISDLSPSVGDLLVWDGSAWVDRALVDGDIPAAIARDAEVTAAVAAEATARASADTAEVTARNAAIAAASATKLFIPPNNFRAAAGSPAQSVERASGGAIGGVPAWVFDAASDESIASSAFITLPWTTVDIAYIWGNTAATSGDVVWGSTSLGAIEDGDSIVGATNSTVTVAAYNVTGKVKFTTVATGIACAQNQLFQIGVLRDADNVADTLANDAALYGVLLTKAS